MTQPPLRTPETVELMQPAHRSLANGVDLYTLAADDFEVARISFLFRAGSARQRKPFVASATANLLAEGSRDLTAREIAERLDFLGSYYDVGIDRDYAYFSFCTLSRYFGRTLEIAEQILLHPRFPEHELATYRAKRRQALAVERTKVDTRAREAFAGALFGATHPYGVIADEKNYDGLVRDDLADFYARHYTAENCFVVCSGRIGPDELAAAAALAERIPQGGALRQEPFPAPVATPFTRIAMPGAVQSSLRVGRLLFPRQHPDFVPMQVVATLLGGYFGSRLMHNLREVHGYTYGAIAAMINVEQAGYLAVATQVGSEFTSAALDEIYREIERLRTEPVPEEELALVKNIMAGEMMRILDGPFGIADVTIENILCGFDNSVIAGNLRRIRAVTPDEVLRLARKYLARETLVTVVAGVPEKPASQEGSGK